MGKTMEMSKQGLLKYYGLNVIYFSQNHWLCLTRLKPFKIDSFGNEYLPTPAKTNNKIIKYRPFDLDKKSHDCSKVLVQLTRKTD